MLPVSGAEQLKAIGATTGLRPISSQSSPYSQLVRPGAVALVGDEEVPEALRRGLRSRISTRISRVGDAGPDLLVERLHRLGLVRVDVLVHERVDALAAAPRPAGLGLKSIARRPLLGGERNATAAAQRCEASGGSGRTARRRASSSQSELELATSGSAPSRIRGASPPGELRRDRQEQLVDQPRRLQLAVQTRAALAEHGSGSRARARSHSSAAARSTPSVVADDRRPGSRSRGGSSSEAVKTTTSPPPSVNSGGVPGQVEAGRRRSPPAGLGEPVPLAVGAQARGRRPSGRSARRASCPAPIITASTRVRSRCSISVSVSAADRARSGRRSSRGRRAWRRSSCTT